MISATHPLARKVAALCLLGGVASLAWTLCVWPILRLPSAKQAAVMTLSKQLHHLQATYSQADALGKREREGLTALKTLNVFWSGASEASMEVSIQVRWPRSAGQVGGEDKLFPGSDYAANFRLDAVTGACPGDGVEPISL